MHITCNMRNNERICGTFHNNDAVLAVWISHHWKTKNCHNANFAIIGDTAGCQYDNLRCPQWWPFWHYDNSHFFCDLQTLRWCHAHLNFTFRIPTTHMMYWNGPGFFCFISGEEAHSARDNMASFSCHRPRWRQVKQCFDKMTTNKSISLSMIIYTTNFRQSSQHFFIATTQY